MGKPSESNNFSQVSRRSKGRKMLTCSDCGKSFPRKIDLARHRSVHTGEKPFSCGDCGKCFNRKDRLVLHRRLHTGEKPFSCGECGKCFLVKRSLVIHERVHTGEKPFSCSECGMRFTRKDCLAQHQSIHTGKRPFSCGDCGWRFRRKDHLEQHRSIHTGKKPLSCIDCGKCFRLKCSLRRHKCFHTNPKQLTCSECRKCFDRKSDLIQHQSIHTGEEPFSCSESSAWQCSRFPADQEKCLCFSECGENLATEDSSKQEKCRLCVYNCKLCGEGLRGSGCHNHSCQMASGELDNDAANICHLENTEKELNEGVCIKEELTIDEIPFESQVSEVFEFTTEELVHLQNDQKKTLKEEMSSKGDEGRKDAPSSVIKDVCAKWSELQSFVALYHPDNVAASRAVNNFNDVVMSHFRKVLKHRQKQVSLDKFLVKREEYPVAESPKCKRLEREITPKAELPEVFMEGNSPFKQ